MRDIITQAQDLKRPKTLVQTAKFGLTHYKRQIHLKTLLMTEHLPTSSEALLKLLELERDINDQRSVYVGSYSYARHISVLTAIMAETALFRDQFQHL